MERYSKQKRTDNDIFFRKILADKFLFVLWVDEMMNHCKTRFVDIPKLQRTTTTLGKIDPSVHRRFVLNDSNWFRGFLGKLRPELGRFPISLAVGCRLPGQSRSFGPWCPWTFTRHLGQGDLLSTLLKGEKTKSNKSSKKSSKLILKSGFGICWLFRPVQKNFQCHDKRRPIAGSTSPMFCPEQVRPFPGFFNDFKNLRKTSFWDQYGPHVAVLRPLSAFEGPPCHFSDLRFLCGLSPGRRPTIGF